MLVSVRRRTLPHKQLAMIREFAAAGKPVVGIRTASHAAFFAAATRSLAACRAMPPGPSSMLEVLEAVHYTGHHGTEQRTAAGGRHLGAAGRQEEPDPGAASTRRANSCVAVRPALQDESAGQVGDAAGHGAASPGEQLDEPAAWTNTTRPRRPGLLTRRWGTGPRIFELPAFPANMLTSGIFWALGQTTPGSADKASSP